MASFDDVDFDDPVDLGRAQFGTQRKGYDQEEVRRFLQFVARHASDRRDALRELETRVAELEASLAQAQSDMVRELSEDELRELLGAEAAKVLSAAHEAYDEQMAEADREQQVRRLKLEADRQTAKQRAAADYQAEIERAKAAGRDLVIEAQVVRERVLRDLNRRRQAGRRELEQVRAGRDRLLATFAGAQDALDAIMAEIEVSLPQARIAAEAAGRRFDEIALAPDEGDTALADGATEDAVKAIEREIQMARDLDLPLVEMPPATPSVNASAEPAPAVASSKAVAPDDDEAAQTVVLRDLGPVRRGLFSKRPKEADELPTMEVPVLRARESFEGVKVVEIDATTTPAPADESVETEEAEAEEAVKVAVPENPIDDTELDGVDPALDSDVDALFAKLRSQKPDPARKKSRSKSAKQASTDGSAGDAEAVAETLAAVTTIGLAAEPEDAAAKAPADSPAPAAAAPDWLRARSETLAELEPQLARQLKRALADDQNELFDVARRSKKRPIIDDLPAAADQARWYFTAIEGMLDRIARAGHECIAPHEKPAARLDLDPPRAAVQDGLITPLRAMIEQAFADETIDDPLAEIRYNARGVRDERVPPAAEQAAFAAFAVGARAALGPGQLVRWVRDPGVCGDDCAARAELAPRPLGDEFDGAAEPPASSGCRCLLVPAGQ